MTSLINQFIEGKLKVWHIVVPFLAIANVAYLMGNIAGWIISLGFFLFVPGYLLLSCLNHRLESRWEIANFSLGLSLLIMIVGGLFVNSFHAFGIDRPLVTVNVFGMLDAVTLVLLTCNWHKRVQLPSLRFHTSIEKKCFSFVLTLLPLLAIGGAIRLNNGASNILTMIMFAAIPVIFLLLIWRENLKPLYPYAIFMFALAVLLSTSLRGWYITGNDIQHEFRVFSQTNMAGFWTMSGQHGDPYNACLSITILPTIIAKITTISAVYIYKAVFQIIFAFSLITMYFLAKRFSNARSALMATFAFISFPTFFNDMPFHNRQEIALIFFGQLLLITFYKISYRTKVIMTLLALFGLILSHYSSGYTTLLLLILSWPIYKLLGRRWLVKPSSPLPILRGSIIIAALLFTFLWNMQMTASTSNLSSAIINTVKGLISHNSMQNGFVQQYSLLSSNGQTQNPAVGLARYAGKNANQVHYVPWSNLPNTAFGRLLSHAINIENLNYDLHSLVAKVFQVLLVIGTIVICLKYRKRSLQKDLYLCALTISSLILLILWTVLPQISIDYTPTRLFQQTLLITALPIIIAIEYLLGLFKRFRVYATAVFLALLFLILSGFIPQALGGYLPQLSLNNSGQYYDFFYSHKADVIATSWLVANREPNIPIVMDTNASTTLIGSVETNPILHATSGYLFEEYINTHKGVYRTNLADGGLTEYTDSALTSNRALLYANGGDRVYAQ